MIFKLSIRAVTFRITCTWLLFRCGIFFYNRSLLYLSSRLTQLGLVAGNGTAKLFCKPGQPASIPFDQFLKALFGSLGQPGSGIRRQANVSARFPCTNQCSRPSVDLKHAYPRIPPKEYQVSRITALLAALSPAQNPAVLKKDFGFENILNYLWWDLALLVGSKQDMWNKYHSLVLLKIWNCNEPIIFGKMQKGIYIAFF